MNRFEALLAPPSLPPKDLRIHIRMHPEIPKEVSAACGDELVNVATRLHDELTTLRFGRTLDDSAAPDRYQRLNRVLTHSGATPIEWRFFAGEFTQFVADHPRLRSTEVMLRTVSVLSDPWRVQAWAAQALRIAQSAETGDPGNAASAWRSAAKLYRAFFDRCDVTESHTYRLQTDPGAQAACQTAWRTFLADEVSALARRAEEYGRRQQAEAVAAAQEALSVPEVAALNPEASRQATEAAHQVIFSGITSASSLRAALDMYRIAPASDERDRGLLAAMAAETRKLAKGFGDVKLITECATMLRLRRVSDDHVGPLMRTARAEFFGAATDLARDALNNEAPAAVKKHAARVLEQVPPEREAGETPSGPVTVAQVLAVLRSEEFREEHSQLESILKRLMDEPADSTAEEAALDQLVTFLGSNRAFATSPGVADGLNGALGAFFSGVALRSLSHDNARARRMLSKITQVLPPNELVDIAGTKHTATQWTELLRSSGVSALPEERRFGALRTRLNRAPVASAEEAEAVTEIIAFAGTHELAPDERTWLDKNLGIVFGNAAGHYLDHPPSNCPCLSIMRQIMEYLPKGTRLDLGGETATLGDHFHVIQFMAALKRSQEAPLGSVEEQRAAAQIIGLLDTGMDVRIAGQSSRAVATAALISLAADNARSPRGDSTTVSMIANHLGSDGARLRDLDLAAVGGQSTQRKAVRRRKRASAGSRLLEFLGQMILLALVVGWWSLAQWIYGIFAGLLWAQILVVALAILLPVWGIWRVAK